jgi:hypothetical protein
MRLTHFVATLLLLMPFSVWAQSNFIVPNTTLAAQTANNTSAANSFLAQSNGNLGANNVSKVDVHTLLSSGTATKVFAHLLLWFAQPGHINVGYNSNSPTQVHNQITDMISRGINGVVIDWYGPNNSIDDATQLVMHEAEQHPGFTFAIMIDAGAIGQNLCPGCSPQEALIQLLQYVEQKYFTSSAYFKIGNQPVVTNFDVDLNYSIDWKTVNSALAVPPRFFFQDSEGFSRALSDGSYSWVMPQTTDYGMSYLSNFYATGLGSPNLETVGAAYKGFNDDLAAWGTGRVMSQQCGQTWLQTFSEANSTFNSAHQLPYLQLVTWNDYDEGTEIESGIDTCLSLSPAISNGTLQWSISGNENTVDHYIVYISQDGQNLMALTQIEPGLHSVNLCSFPIPAGNYQLFVQAVGKPSMANRMPGPVVYTPACASGAGGSGSGNGSANSGLSAYPSAVTVSGSNPAQVTVTASQSATINGTVSLSCSSLPANLTCSFSPATIDIGSGTPSSSLTLAAASATAKNSPPSRKSERREPFNPSWFLSFGVLGFAFLGNVKRDRKRNVNRRHTILIMLMVCSLATSVILTASCGGGSTGQPGSSGAPAANSYTVSVVGSSSSGQVSTQVVVSLTQGN